MRKNPVLSSSSEALELAALIWGDLTVALLKEAGVRDSDVEALMDAGVLAPSLRTGVLVLSEWERPHIVAAICGIAETTRGLIH